MRKNTKLNIKGVNVTVLKSANDDYISLTDIANTKENDSRAADIIKNWIRNRGTIEFIGTWEKLNNPDFKVVEFDHFKMQAGLTSFVLSPGKWVEQTNTIGIVVKKGKYGGTYAQKDIALEFCSAISPIFKLFLIKEFQRLKETEAKELDWNVKRQLTKINYHIHTDAIKENLIPKHLTARQINYVYASEADVLNMALFGVTAQQWRDENADKKGNIRDYANVSQLVCLANLESLNAVFVNEKISQSERLVKLNQIAINQMQILLQDNNNLRSLRATGEAVIASHRRSRHCEPQAKQPEKTLNTMTRGGAVYIMASKRNGTLYTGVTADLKRRVFEHKTKANPKSFTAKYNCQFLVYYEGFHHIKDAIAEEKRIKGGNRKNKLKLIETINPFWKDLWEEIKEW